MTRSQSKLFQSFLNKIFVIRSFLYVNFLKIFLKVDPCPLPISHKILLELSKSSIRGTRGFYIECGANDGIKSSNTLFLERLGWTGLLVEPSPAAFEALIKNRESHNFFANCALVATDDISLVTGDFDGSLMSSINSNRTNRACQITVPSSTLQSLINEYSVTNIDFFPLMSRGLNTMY